MGDRFGEVSERFKEPVLKTGDGETHREFESHTLRQFLGQDGSSDPFSVVVIMTTPFYAV